MAAASLAPRVGVSPLHGKTPNFAVAATTSGSLILIVAGSSS